MNFPNSSCVWYSSLFFSIAIRSRFLVLALRVAPSNYTNLGRYQALSPDPTLICKNEGEEIDSISYFKLCCLEEPQWKRSLYFPLCCTLPIYLCGRLVAKLCPTPCNPKDSCLPGSSVHGIPRQEYWSGLPFPSPENLPDPGIKPESPAWQVDSSPLSHLGSLGSTLAHNKTLIAPEDTLYNLRLSLWIGDFKQLIHNTK